MVKLWPRRQSAKQSNETNLPQELKQYYQSGQRERKSVAWLLAFSALVVTLVVAFGAYLGGRWVYRKIANRSKPQVSTSQPSASNQNPSSAPTGNQNQNPQSNSNSPAAQSSPPPSNSQPSAPSTPNQPSTTSTPASGDNSNLARTGPTDTLTVFIAATALGAGFYELKLHYKSKNS